MGPVVFPFELTGVAHAANTALGSPPQLRQGRTTFNSRTGESTELEESQISNPVFAAMITGLLRAVVSEILANLPQNITVLSVTTDGWLSDASQQEVISATNGPLCSLFRKLRGFVSIDGLDQIIELKSTAKTVLICKTRRAWGRAAGCAIT